MSAGLSNGGVGYLTTKLGLLCDLTSSLSVMSPSFLFPPHCLTPLSERHLEEFLWDLPLFDSGRSMQLVRQLASRLGISVGHVARALGVDKARLGERMVELFGGIPGYTADCMRGLTMGRQVSEYATRLVTDIEHMIRKRLDRPGMEADWLSEITNGRWAVVRNIGLCGRYPPRDGVILNTLIGYLRLRAGWSVSSVCEHVSVGESDSEECVCMWVCWNMLWGKRGSFSSLTNAYSHTCYTNNMIKCLQLLISQCMFPANVEKGRDCVPHTLHCLPPVVNPNPICHPLSCANEHRYLPSCHPLRGSFLTWSVSVFHLVPSAAEEW